MNRKDRLRKPLIRRDLSEGFEETTWEEALDYIAEKLPPYKGSRFAILTSPNSTTEEHYLAQKFARVVMITNNVDQTSNTRPDLVGGLEEALGYSAATNPVWDLEGARVHPHLQCQRHRGAQRGCRAHQTSGQGRREAHRH